MPSGTGMATDWKPSGSSAKENVPCTIFSGEKPEDQIMPNTSGSKGAQESWQHPLHVGAELPAGQGHLC